MKYYFRYVKIVKISGKKNYPSNMVLKDDDDGGYTILHRSSDYSQYNNVYKYQDKYIETANVIEIDLIDFKEISKQRGTVYAGYETYEHYDGYTGMTIYRKDTPPNPFNCFDYRSNNKYQKRTKTKNINKHEIYIGLYKYNELTNKYEFILHSLYNKNNLMYYVAKN